MNTLDKALAGKDDGGRKKNVFEAANDWEASRIQAIEASERRAWKVAIGAVIVAVLAWLVVVMLLPLKETIPYIYRTDTKTGVPDLITAMTDKQVTGDEVMDKYWLAQYVRARETYDWYTLQNDYDTVGLLSSAPVGAAYSQLFEGKDALDKKYGKSVRATTQIVSVVPDVSNRTAAVRFTKTTKRIEQEGPETTTRWVATIAYEYRSTARIKESARLVNPFGFQVLSYRVDPELGGGAQ